jgi:hypothetical protein
MSVKKEPVQLEKNGIFSRCKDGVERRNEVRIKKEIPVIFLHKKRTLEASTVNYSKNGLGIKIFKKVALPVGDMIDFKAKSSSTKVQVIWTKREIDPVITLAGLKIMNGTLNLKGARKTIGITMTTPFYKEGLRGDYHL